MLLRLARFFSSMLSQFLKKLVALHQITVNGQTVNLTYSHYDENGEETKLPNSTEPSELEDDVLVNISSLADAWEVDIYWSRTTENGVTTDKGWVISP